MKILLAAVNAKYIHSNLAVYSLKAYAEKSLAQSDCGGLNVKPDITIAEYTINQQEDEILRDIFQGKPDILCLSCYIWNLTCVENIVREIHKVLPETHIWLGGPEVSYDARAVLGRLPEVDGIMMGEGEKTFLELVRFYCGGTESLAQIKGIAWRERSAGKEERIRENPWREVMDLSEIPFVYENMEGFEHKIIYYESSRGCPFSCSYCLSSVDKCLRFRDLELVKRELQFFIDQRVPQVKFVDRTFNCRHDHAMTVWRYIQEHDNGITNFHFEISADLLREEELELMRQMRPGLIQLEIGVQSTNPQTIREIRRTMKFEEVGRIVKRINSFGNIHQHLDLIAGLPYENYDSFKSSFDDVYKLEPEQLQLGFLKVLKGSYMEERKEDYGLVYKGRPPYEVLYTKWLSYEEILRLKGIEEMVEVYYNSRQFCYTLPYLIGKCEGAFSFFEALSLFYSEKALDTISHSRITRYEILLEFAEKLLAGQREGDEAGIEKVRQLLTLDLYLRENVKNRPAFAGEGRCTKELERDFYEREAEERRYLRGYESYDKRSLRKMTHIESFSYDVTGELEERRTVLLFDYLNRSPLNHQAKIFRILECQENEGNVLQK